MQAGQTSAVCGVADAARDARRLPVQRFCHAADAAALPARTPAQPLTDDERQTLRAFDLDLKFGPCIGPSRLERWERAERLGLEPPSQVKRILVGRNDDDNANQSLLSAYSL